MVLGVLCLLISLCPTVSGSRRRPPCVLGALAHKYPVVRFHGTEVGSLDGPRPGFQVAGYSDLGRPAPVCAGAPGTAAVRASPGRLGREVPSDQGLRDPGEPSARRAPLRRDPWVVGTCFPLAGFRAGSLSPKEVPLAGSPLSPGVCSLQVGGGGRPHVQPLRPPPLPHVR